MRAFRLLLAAAVVVGALAWLAASVGGPRPSDAPSAAAPAARGSIAPSVDREAVQQARAEARARWTEKPGLLPPDPPPVGVPAWVKRLPNQPAYRVPDPLEGSVTAP